MASEDQNSHDHVKRVQHPARQSAQSELSRKLQTANRQFRRSGKNKRVRSRRKDWADDAFGDSDEMENVSLERIMPRDESARRRTVESAARAVGTPTGDQPGTRSTPHGLPLGLQGVVVTAVGMSARVEMADRVVVMFRGNKVEEGTVTEIFENPQQERTKLFLSQTL
mgnify:CR=1 FL=1